MHLLLTDRLTCPRCGPDFGLILLARRMSERAVLEGELGCPNCRDAFGINDGFADLRAPPRGTPPAGLAGPPPRLRSTALGATGAEHSDDVVRDIPALLGVVGGPGTVALVGEPARVAAAVASLSEEIHVVAVDADMGAWPESPRVSRMMAAPGLPFFDSTLRAVALDDRLGPAWLREAARAVVPRGRVVVTHATEGAEEAVRAAGLTVLASEAGTVVAARS